MIKKYSLGIRIDESIRPALEKAAADDRRSLASYVEILIIRDLEAKGLWPKPKVKK